MPQSDACGRRPMQIQLCSPAKPPFWFTDGHIHTPGSSLSQHRRPARALRAGVRRASRDAAEAVR
jgi:hypothetical protein